MEKWSPDRHIKVGDQVKTWECVDQAVIGIMHRPSLHEWQPDECICDRYCQKSRWTSIIENQQSEFCGDFTKINVENSSASN